MDAFAGGLLVQSLIAYWFHVRFGVEVGSAWQYLLRRQYSGGYFCLAGGPAGEQIRPDQHDGLYTYPLEYFVDPGSADANSAACDWSSASAL